MNFFGDCLGASHAAHDSSRGENPDWVTRSVAVPPAVLYPAIGDCLRIPFEPTEVAQ